jgi:hypothetical protein
MHHRMALLAVVAIAWWWPGPSLAARPPDPDDARTIVSLLVDAIANQAVGADDIYRYFVPAERGFEKIDRRRLFEALCATGPLGAVLAHDRPEVAATVVGPDYVRVVLATEPHLSFLVRRSGGEALISRWELTSCTDCREPVRFVADALAAIRDRDERRFVPGIDLFVAGGGAHEDEGFWRWRLAFQVRNFSAGYLRHVARHAEVLDLDIDGVRVDLNDRVETWPVRYEDGQWMLDYDALPPDSKLRLDASELSLWEDEAKIREKALAWWTPWDRKLPDGGVLRAMGSIGVGYDPLADRWLVALERLDQRLAGLVALDTDGLVEQRWAFPNPAAEPGGRVHGWLGGWKLTFSSNAQRLFLSGFDRWWLLDIRPDGTTREMAVGNAGAAAAAWSPGGDLLAWADERGSVHLYEAVHGEERTARSVPGTAGEVVGLAFSPGGGRLLALWGNGALRDLRAPSLDPGPLQATACRGAALGLAFVPLSGVAIARCDAMRVPVALTRVPTEGWMEEPDVRDDLLGGPPVSASPDGRLLVLGYRGVGGAAALADADTLEPLVAFSGVPLRSVAWNADGSEILAQREDGSVVWWSVPALLQSAQGIVEKP